MNAYESKGCGDCEVGEAEWLEMQAVVRSEQAKSEYAAKESGQMKKGDIVEHVGGGRGEVRAVEGGTAVVRVMDTCFHDIRRIPVEDLSVVLAGAKMPETWVDAKGQVVYVKGSRKNKADGLVRSEFVAIMESGMISGTVTREDGKVFYIPFRKQ